MLKGEYFRVPDHFLDCCREDTLSEQKIDWMREFRNNGLSYIYIFPECKLGAFNSNQHHIQHRAPSARVWRSCTAVCCKISPVTVSIFFRWLFFVSPLLLLNYNIKCNWNMQATECSSVSPTVNFLLWSWYYTASLECFL